MRVTKSYQKDILIQKLYLIKRSLIYELVVMDHTDTNTLHAVITEYEGIQKLLHIIEKPLIQIVFLHADRKGVVRIDTVTFTMLFQNTLRPW